jgi:hypothetical protein
MANKFFNFSGAPWQIIQTQDPWGTPRTIAVEMDSTYGAMLNTEEYGQGSDWEYVEATSVFIDEWFLKSDPNELFEVEVEEEDDNFLEDQQRYVDMMSKVHSKSDQSSRLKEMLEGLKNPPFDESNRTVGQAEDILGMIRARQSNEMRPTVILNARKYTDSKTLESALDTIRKKDAEAEIWVGTTRADDFLATLKNQEIIGLSSVPDPTKPLGLTLDQEMLDLIKKLGPKK